MKRRNSHATRHLINPSTRRWAAAIPAALGNWLQEILRSGGRGLIGLGIGGIMLALIGLLAANFVGQIMQSARLEANRAAVAAEVDQLRDQNSSLEGAVAFAESDVNAERIAREQLGYARDGDTVLLPQLVQSPPADAPADAVPVAIVPPPAPPNWARWWQAFFP